MPWVSAPAAWAGRKPESVVDRQACAAAGQGALVAFYDGLFQRLGVPCAPVLLTEEDFHFRQRFNNLTATLERLLELRAVPILNENDTLSTAELALEKGAVSETTTVSLPWWPPTCAPTRSSC